MNESLGHITITPAVLRTIAILTAFGVPGVIAVGKIRSKDRSNWAFPFDGIRVLQKDDATTVDLDLTVADSVNIVDIGKQVQHEIAEAFANLADTENAEINVRIQSVA